VTLDSRNDLETQERMTIETLDVTTLETQHMRLETQRMRLETQGMTLRLKNE